MAVTTPTAPATPTTPTEAPKLIEVISSSTHDCTCKCGKVEIELVGRPYFRVECHCADCRQAAQAIEGLAAPLGHSYTNDLGGSDLCAWMDDAISFKQGHENLAYFEVVAGSGTRRLVSTCCHTSIGYTFEGQKSSTPFVCFTTHSVFPPIKQALSCRINCASPGTIPKDEVNTAKTVPPYLRKKYIRASLYPSRKSRRMPDHPIHNVALFEQLALRDNSNTKADDLAEVPVAGPGLDVTFTNESGESWTGTAVSAAKLGMRIGENNRKVLRVEKGGQAAKAGVQVGDEVVKVNGHAMPQDGEQIREAVKASGADVQIEFMRPAKAEKKKGKFLACFSSAKADDATVEPAAAAAVPSWDYTNGDLVLAAYLGHGRAEAPVASSAQSDAAVVVPVAKAAKPVKPTKKSFLPACFGSHKLQADTDDDEAIVSAAAPEEWDAELVARFFDWSGMTDAAARARRAPWISGAVLTKSTATSLEMQFARPVRHQAGPGAAHRVCEGQARGQGGGGEGRGGKGRGGEGRGQDRSSSSTQGRGGSRGVAACCGGRCYACAEGEGEEGWSLCRPVP